MTQWGGLGLGAALMVGCGSSWDLRGGATLTTGCQAFNNYYLDIDGDGWGVPTKDGPRPRCSPDPESGFTATNALDCDDTNPDVTGRLGALCPAEIAGPDTACVDGLAFGEQEYVVVCTPVTPERATAAVDRCEAWAGEPVAGDDGGATRGLADLGLDFERAEVLDLWLLPLEAILVDFTMFVDLRWEGTLDDGEWRWGSGRPATGIPQCTGEEAHPGDFYPELRLEQPEARASLQARVPELRLALRRQAEGGWCQGVPPELPPYELRSAHFLCERPRPDPERFAERPEAR